MKRKITIEPFEEHDAVTFYTIRFKNDTSETDKFFKNFPEGSEFDEDIDIIIKWLDKIGENCALERYFRPEGKMKDKIFAIPLETSNLRLYCIRINDGIVILGNGGIKGTPDCHNDPLKNMNIMLLQNISFKLKKNIDRGKTYIYKNQLYENLEFTIN